MISVMLRSCKVLGVIYLLSSSHTKTLPLGKRGNYSNSLATNDKATNVKYYMYNMFQASNIVMSQNIAQHTLRLYRHTRR